MPLRQPLYSNLFAGRVTAQYKEFYRVMTEAGELLAEVSGKLRFNAAACLLSRQ